MPTHTDAVLLQVYHSDELPLHLKETSTQWAAQLHGNVTDSAPDSHSGVVWRPKEYELWLFRVDGNTPVAKVGVVALGQVTVDELYTVENIVAIGSLMAIEQGKGYGSRLVHEAEAFARKQFGAHIAILGCSGKTVPFYQRLGWDLCPNAEQLYTDISGETGQRLPWVDKMLIHMLCADNAQEVEIFKSATIVDVHGLPI